MVRSICLLSVVLAAAAWAGDGSAQLEQCNEQYADCRENCTIDYGTSVKQRTQLNKCQKKCVRKRTDCRSTIEELVQVGIDVPDEKPKKKEEPAVVERKPLEEEVRPPVEERRVEPPKEEAKPVEEEEEKPAAVAEKPPEKKEEKKQPAVVEKPAEKPVEKPKKKEKGLDEWDEGDIDR